MTRSTITHSPALEAWLLTFAIMLLAGGFLLVQIAIMENEIADLRHKIEHPMTQPVAFAARE